MSDAVKDILVSAAHLINMRLDPEARPFTDTQVKGFIALAYRDVVRQLQEREITNLRFETDIVVPAGTTSIGMTTTPALPSNFLYPIRSWERQTGGIWSAMTQALDHVPLNAVQSDSMRIWSWRDGKIQLIGAVSDVTIRFHYIGRLDEILLPSDTLGLPDLINPIAYTAAGLALGDEYLTHKGREALLGLSNIHTHAKQGTSYRRRRLRRGIRVGR